MITGEKVELIGEDNPFKGEVGTFSHKGKMGENEVIYVVVDGSCRYFYPDEVQSQKGQATVLQHQREGGSGRIK